MKNDNSQPAGGQVKINYLPIIGIEVHVELKTNSKMFCGCSANHFRVLPNSHTCPTCLGLPGALPVPNKKAIDWCLLIGLALGCKINKESKFDRKNYFYPDLPKGYQISQYDMPFARNGELKLKIKNEKLKIIRINRVHMEEDTAKLIHDVVEDEKVTLIDFNRSGVPLVEIVTEPDINSSEEAVIYLKKIQQIIRYLDVSDCDMEKGSMRCEINISLGTESQSYRVTESQSDKVTESQSHRVIKLPDYKVEVKNINSFKFVKKAIEYEVERQEEILNKGEIPHQETRGFSEKTNKTFIQRSKEEAHDYRYFPEPDIPPFKLSNQLINQLSNQLIELPDEKKERFIKKYKLSRYNADILTQDKKTADYFEEAIGIDKAKALEISNLIINKKIDINKIKAKDLINLLKQKITNNISDPVIIKSIIAKVISNNKKAVSDYKKGKSGVLGFLIGQGMKETKGKADVQLVKKILLEKLVMSKCVDG